MRDKMVRTLSRVLAGLLLTAAFVISASAQPQLVTRLSLERSARPSTGAPVTMQQAYELRCRGGGLRINSTPGRSLPTGEQMTNMTVDFVAGTQATGGRAENLKPGQCSWVDRGFRQGEPSRVRLEIVYFAQQKQTLHGSPVDRSPTAAERYPDAQNVPQYLSSANRYWSFWVYNTNNGYLQATGQRYFKPLAIRINPNDKVKVFPGR